MNPCSEPGTPYHSTPLNYLGDSLDEVWASGSITGVRPINKTLKCVVENRKLLGAKPKKMPLKPQGALLAKTSAEATVLKPLNSTYGSTQFTQLSRKPDCRDCSSTVISKTFDKIKEAPSEKEHPSLLSHKGETKPTSKIKENPSVKKQSSETATKSGKLLRVQNGKLNALSPTTGPPSAKGASRLTVSRLSGNNEKSPNHMLSSASRPNSTRSSVSSLSSTRSVSSQQPKKKSAPPAQLIATKVMNLNKVTPTNSAKDTVKPMSRTSVRNKVDQKEVQQSKPNFSRDIKAGDVPKVGKETLRSAGVAAKSSGTRAKSMQPPKSRTQPRLPSKTGYRTKPSLQ